jgi:hypothetical protein
VRRLLSQRVVSDRLQLGSGSLRSPDVPPRLPEVGLGWQPGGLNIAGASFNGLLSIPPCLMLKSRSRLDPQAAHALGPGSPPSPRGVNPGVHEIRCRVQEMAQNPRVKESPSTFH